MKPHGYPKQEKLKQKKQISLLFEKGKWKTCGNIRLITLQDNTLRNPKIGVSVSKRNFKKAVDRNRIKRLLREAYRLNKTAFQQKFGNNSLSMLFWNSKSFPKHYAEVEEEFLKLCKPKN